MRLHNKQQYERQKKMKKFLLTTFLVLALFAINLQAQWDSGYPIMERGNSTFLIKMELTLDSTASSATAPDSLATGWYDISDFDASLEYATLFWDVDLDGDQDSGTDTSGVLIDLWGSESPSWTDAVLISALVDTSGAAASSADYYVTTVSIVPTYVASAFSNKRPTYINIVLENQSKTGNLHTFDDSLGVSAVFKLPIKDAGVVNE